ncbi:MAG: nuclear transport factor 2 family protein [Vicinamibacterales bacterium]
MTALAACLGVVLALAAAQSTDDTAAIVDLEQRLAAAWVKGDRAFIDGLLAADWSVTDGSGRVLTKAQLLEETFGSADRRIETMAIDDVRVRFVGGVAIVTGRTRATGSYKGQSGTAVLRFTDVFTRRDGRWQIVVSHGSAVAP